MIRTLLGIICWLTVSNSLIFAQCFDSKTFYPTPGTTTFSDFGYNLDTFEDFLVVGAQSNNSLATWSGTAHVYQLGASQKWSKIADLRPSTSSKFMDFGRQTAIHGNTIAITASQYNDAGVGTEMIYIFDKPASGWTTSVETYVLSLPGMWVYDLDLVDDKLIAVVGTTGGQSQIRVFTRTAGIFTLTQIINSPLDARSKPTEFDHMIATSEMIVVAAAVYQSSASNDHAYGAVLIYKKNGSNYNDIPDAVLRPTSSNDEYIEFGRAFAVNNSTIIVGGGYYPGQSPVSYGIYVYERPVTGWASATESAIVPMTTPYFSLQFTQMVISGNYIFLGDQRAFESRLHVFRKTMFNWTSGVEETTISNPFPGSQFAWQLAMAGDDHLVVGSPNHPYVGTFGDVVMDYYFPQHDWENMAYPQQFIQQPEVNAGYSWFGNDIAATKDQLIVGAPEDFNKGYGAGAAYVFDLATPSAAPQKIYSPRPQNVSSFGHAVATGDSLLFVSALFEDTVFTSTSKWWDIGKVFVYRLGANGWEYRSQIVAPTIKANAYFGQEITYHNGYVAISEFYTRDTDSPGRVHIYKQDGTDHFDFLATMRPSEDTRSDFFGNALTLNDSLLVVGTGSQEYTAGFARKVFIYKKKGEWKNAVEDARLISSDKVFGDYFGSSVAVDGEYIVVGAPGYPHSSIVGHPNRSGGVYVFKRPPSGWNGDHYEIAKLQPTDPSGESLFGHSVAITGNDIYIGSPKGLFWWNVVDHATNYGNHHKPGKVYHFAKHGPEWISSANEDDVIMSDNPNWLDGFGNTLLMHNGMLSIGASMDNNHTGFMAGSVKTMIIAPTMDAICTSNDPVELPSLLNTPGIWVGTGVNSAGNMFDPAASGPGIHKLTFISNSNNCHATMKVTVLAGPALPVTNIGPLCNTGASFDLGTIATGGTWNGQGVSATTFDPKKVTPGLHPLAFTNSIGCSSILTAEVLEGRINLITSSNPEEKKCPGEEIALIHDTDATADRYQWLYRASLSEAYAVIATNTKTISSNKVGFYAAKIIDKECPGNITEFIVKDFAIPAMAITPTPILCEADEILLYATPGGGTWEGSSITPDGHLNSAPLNSGVHKYIYSLITNDGCTAKDSTLVTVYKYAAIPMIIATSPEACFDTPSYLKLDIDYPGATVNWYLEGSDEEFMTGYQAEVTKADSYYARITNFGCTVETEPITIVPMADSLYVPNVFTPNGDQFNDYFEIESKGLSNFNVQILNRYGNEIFRAETPQFKWPGAGTSGTYFWHITYRDCSGGSKNYKGWVQVIE